MEDIYKNIRKRRVELGMSQDELARKVGYTSRSTIARIERGDINLPHNKIVEIAKALRVTPSYLAGWEADITIDDDGEPMLLAELTATQEAFMEEYFQLTPHQQQQIERLVHYLISLDEPKANLVVELAESLSER